MYYCLNFFVGVRISESLGLDVFIIEINEVDYLGFRKD